MAATIARLHSVASGPADRLDGSRPAEAFSSEAHAANGLLDRLTAAGAVALTMALLFGLLIGEYVLVWRLIFAPWTESLRFLMP